MEWIEINEAAASLGIDEATFRSKCGRSLFAINANGRVMVRRSLLASLAAAPASSDAGDFYPTPATVAKLDRAFRAAYNKAPIYNKRQYDLYYPILMASEGLVGKALSDFVDSYNGDNPDNRITLQTLYRKREQLRVGGKAALLGNYGKRRGKTSVPDDAYEVFEAIYKSRKGAATKTWRATAGIMKVEAGVDVNALPKVDAFRRRFRNTNSKAVEVCAREGKAAYNRKCAPYVIRDYKKLFAGELWVADHFQIDGKFIVPGRERPVRPWVTSWMDVKSGKILGWHIYADSPNADDIFAAFYNAASVWGVPSAAHTDNGKDFRAKDLTGGRGKVRISMAAELGIRVVFGTPYNPQTKQIERTQQEMNAGITAFAKGYCGGTILKRPEDHAARIKSGDIETFEEFCELFSRYVNNVLNRQIYTSGHRKGQSPDQIWRDGFPLAVERGLVKKVLDEDLKLLCYRTSKVLTICRGGIKDSEVGIYRGDCLLLHDRKKVYLLRNHSSMLKPAYVYDAKTHEELGQVTLEGVVPALVKDDLSYAELQEAIRRNRRVSNLVFEGAQSGMDIPLEKIVTGLETYTASVSDEPDTELPNVNNSVMPITITRRSGIAARAAKIDAALTPDLSPFGPLAIPEKTVGIYNFEWEREEALARTACAG